MSQQYGRIDSGLVVHHHFRSLTIEAKLLCLFLRATPRGNAIGCFYYPVSQIVDDLGDQLTADQAKAALAELAERCYAKYCPVTRWVWIPKHLDHFPVRGRNSGTHALDVMETVPRDFSYSDELIEGFERNHDWSTDREAKTLDARWKGLLATFEGASKDPRRVFEGGSQAPSKGLPETLEGGSEQRGRGFERATEPPSKGIPRARAHAAAAGGELDSSPDRFQVETRQETTAGAAVDGPTAVDREPADDLFGEILEWGVQHVAEKGPLSRHTAQTYIASRCKTFGEPAVARLLLALKAKPVVEPRSWLDAHLKKGDPHAADRGHGPRSAVDIVREANEPGAPPRSH